jgi:hypothetical protein
MLCRSPAVCALILAATVLPAQNAATPHAKIPEDPEQFIQQAMPKNDIDLEGAKPWELKATFQLFDPQGAPLQTFEVDEIWVGPDQQRQTWTGASFHQILIMNHDRTFRSGDETPIPDLIESALHTVVHPVPDSKESAATNVDMRRKKFGKDRYNCVASLPMSPPPTVLVGGSTLMPRPVEYCFDIESLNYRFTLSSDARLKVDSKTPFRNAQAGSQVSIAVGKIVRVIGKVDDLRSIPAPDPQAFVPPVDAVDQNAPAPRSASAAGIKGGRLIHRVDAVLPLSFGGSKQTLSLRATIGTDGHVHSVNVLGKPNPELAKAASNAVQQWVYEPYTWNGVPIEVGATITFTFGP